MTFSIAGVCPRTGQLGCAVATSSMAVGARVGQARAGLAVALSQARTDPRLHGIGLDAVANGADAAQAAAAMGDAAVQPRWRQLGILLANGTGAFSTGASCFPYAGGRVGTHCLALGNGICGSEVLAAMADGFEHTPADPLADRLLDALAAGLEAGGEYEPLRSSSLLVHAEHPVPWTDLRVDDSVAPIVDLRALWREWAPKADGYIQRALDPGIAPDSSILEARPR